MLLFSWFLLCGLLIIVFGEGFTVVAQKRWRNPWWPGGTRAKTHPSGGAALKHLWKNKEAKKPQVIQPIIR
jgi:hypothetical protein